MSLKLYDSWVEGGKDYVVNNSTFYKQLRKKKKLDSAFHHLDAQVFEKMDCLVCANCCKTTSPVFQQSDIERVAKSLKMKVPEFIDTYLHIDEDGDYVLNSTPCPFLGHDHKCIVYKSRPTACKEYPHTNRKRVHQILKKTFKNAEVCPAVYNILERLKSMNS